MVPFLRLVISVLILAMTGTLAGAQTVLYDFQDEPAENDFPNTFGHFGTITIDGGLVFDCDGITGNICRYHRGNFDDASPIPDPSRFGLIEIGPNTPSTLLDLTGFVGYSIDARLIRDTDGPGGFDDFQGIAPLEIGIQWDPNDQCPGSMDACSDVYAEPVELTETFQTYTVMFADFVLPGTPLNSVQIKMILKTGVWDGSVLPAVKLEDLSSGVGRLEYNNIIGILPPAAVEGDYNENGVVDAADYTVWRDTLGSMSDLRADGDDSGTIDAPDYGFWKARFGNSMGSGSLSALASVPEPTSAWLIASGLLGLARLRRRRK